MSLFLLESTLKEHAWPCCSSPRSSGVRQTKPVLVFSEDHVIMSAEPDPLPSAPHFQRGALQGNLRFPSTTLVRMRSHGGQVAYKRLQCNVINVSGARAL